MYDMNALPNDTIFAHDSMHYMYWGGGNQENLTESFAIGRKLNLSRCPIARFEKV